MIETVVSGLGDAFSHGHLHVLLDLRRSPGVEALRDAARATVEAYPVLGRRLEPRFWRGRWVDPIEDAGVLVQRLDADGDLEAATRAWTHRAIDVEREPPWRLALLEHGDGCRLVVSLHHLVADGAGTLAVTNFFAARLAGEAPFAPPGSERGLFQLLRALRLRDLPTLLVELAREALRPIGILCIRRHEPPFPTSAEDGGPRWTTLTLDEERAGRFIEQCHTAEATINDGLVAALMRLAARRKRRGPLAVAYTIDVRRYVPRRAVVSNLSGATIVSLPRRLVKDAASTLRATSARIGDQKRRLPGLAFNLWPALALGWLPQGLLRLAGRVVVGNIFSYLGRALVLTNIGAVDKYVAPLGDDLLSASMVGPFLGGVNTPVINVTGFRGRLTLQVCGCGHLTQEGLEAYRDEIEDVLTS